MSRESTLLAGRQAAEEAFTDVASFKRLTGRTAVDPVTLREEPVYVHLFTTKCKIRIGAVGTLVPVAAELDEGGREITTLRSVMHLPMNAPPLLPNDIAEMSGAGLDTQISGRTYRVVAPIVQTYATARRFSVEEVLS